MTYRKTRAPRQKRDTIKVYFGWAEGNGPDLCVTWGPGVYRCDARLVLSAFEGTRENPVARDLGHPSQSWLLKELEERGYDLSTFRMTIKKKPPEPAGGGT